MKDFVISEALRDRIMLELFDLSTTTCSSGEESAAELQMKLEILPEVDDWVEERKDQRRLDSPV